MKCSKNIDLLLYNNVIYDDRFMSKNKNMGNEILSAAFISSALILSGVVLGFLFLKVQGE
jgi:hypothetical protein